MDPITGGLIMGGASLLGNIFSSSTSASNTQAQIAAAQQQTQQQEQFQMQMSNTAYQRASADMKAAGLNPAMMFGSGAAASTPGGASNVPQISRTSPLANLGQAAQSAVQTAVSMKTMDKMADEMANLKSENEAIKATAGLTRERTSTQEQETLKTANENALLGLGMNRARFESLSAADLNNLDPTIRKLAVQAGWIGGKASDVMAPIVSTAGAASRLSDAFTQLSKSNLQKKIDRGNFIGKYGQPIDEYLADK